MLKDYFQQLLEKHIAFAPTQDQQKLLNAMSDFVTTPQNDSIFVVNGYAGTGKTTVIGALVRSLHSIKKPVVLLAPTGRAAKIMSSYSGTSAFTIHKKIYRQSRLHDGVGAFALNLNSHSNAIFIIDEASMIANSSSEASIFGTGKLLDDLVKFVRTGKNCKLILVGDSAQLPPVGISISPALDENYLGFYGDNTIVQLNEVVRQTQNSGILNNATLIRQHLEAKKTGFPLLQVENYKDIVQISGGDLIETLSDTYSKFGEENVMVITRSNKQANLYNAGIRDRIFGKEESVERNDRLMVVKNNYTWVAQDEGLCKEIPFIANGDIVILQRLRKHYEMYGLHFADATISLPDYNHAELNCRLLLNTLTTETSSLNTSQSKVFFTQVSADYAHIMPAAKRYAEIRSDPFFSALQIKHAYATTCHKAQGGQWKAVFIDHGYLQDESVNVDFLRWLYTAITRASEQLY
ncbi:MAG: ATP-dependent DNA helicase, partial [Bacteroidales bacterium]